MTRRVQNKFILVLVVVLAWCWCSSGDSSAPPTVCVLDFINTTDPVVAAQDWDWLGRGLSDLVTTDVSGKCRVVNRERLANVLKELDLSSMGLTEDKGQTVARFLKVEFVVGGSYRFQDNGRLRILAWLMDADSGKIRRVKDAEGAIDDVPRLSRLLSHQIFTEMEIPVTKKEVELLRSMPLASIDSLRSYSLGLKEYDAGDSCRALALFRMAARDKSPVPNAGLWAGRLYLDFDEARHAILEWESICSRCPSNPVIAEVHWQLAESYRNLFAKPELAATNYGAIITLFPESERFSRACGHMGTFYEKQRKYGQAWRVFEQACIKGGLAACSTYSGPLLRCYSYALSEGETNRISLSILNGGYYGRCHYATDGGAPLAVAPEEHLIFIAPPGKVFTSATYSVDVQIAPGLTNNSQVFASVFGQVTRDSATLTGTVSFASHHNIFHASVVARDAKVGQLTIAFGLRAAKDGAPVGQVNAAESVRTRSDKNYPFVGSLTATRDRKGRYHIVFNEVVFVDGDSRISDDEADLFASLSLDGVQWALPNRLSVNSFGLDASPSLIHRHDGEDVLAWNSRRTEQRVDRIWLSRGRIDGEMASPYAVDSIPQASTYGPISPTLMELPGGNLRLFFAEDLNGGRKIFAVDSPDGVIWGKPHPVGPNNSDGPASFVMNVNGSAKIFWPQWRAPLACWSSPDGLTFRAEETNLSDIWAISIVRDGCGVYWIAFRKGTLEEFDCYLACSQNAVDWTDPVPIRLPELDPCRIYPALICDGGDRLLVAWSRSLDVENASRRDPHHRVGLAPIPFSILEHLTGQMRSAGFRSLVERKIRAQELMETARKRMNSGNASPLEQLSAIKHFVSYVTGIASDLLNIEGGVGRGLGSVRQTLIAFLERLPDIVREDSSAKNAACDMLMSLTLNGDREIARNAWTRLGDIAWQQKDIENAAKFYTHAEAWQVLGNAFVDIGAYERAAMSYKRSTDWDVIQKGANRLMVAGYEDEAMALLETQRGAVISNNSYSKPGALAYYYQLLELYLLHDRLADAVCLVDGVSRWYPFGDNMALLVELRARLARLEKDKPGVKEDL